MKILITGGAGFVGTNLVAKLVRDPRHKIVVLDDESLGKREYLAEFSGVEFVKGDIRDGACLRDVLAGRNAVVHLAADTRVMDSIADPLKNFSVNVAGSVELLQRAREAGVRRIVNASTGGAILGEAAPPVHENMVASPLSPYGASKLAVEGYLSAFNGSYGMNAISLRFSNIYGPRSYHKGSVVAAFYKALMAGKALTVFGDGSQRRDFLFVEDLVTSIERAIHSDVSGVFQLGSGRPTSIIELIRTMRDVVGASVEVGINYEEFRKGEIHSTWCDISRARDALGFDPGTTLRNGLRRTWNWFLESSGHQRPQSQGSGTAKE